MSKESGLGWTTFSVDNSASSPNAIKNDITNFQFATPRGVQDTSGLDVSGYERLLLRADFTVGPNGVFNDASNMSHDTFKDVSSTSVARTTTLTISGQTLACETLYTDYNLTRAADGSLTWTAPGVLTGGLVPAWA